MTDSRPAVDLDTIPEIEIPLTVMRVAEKENLSVTSALDEAQERIRDEAINDDHPNRRAFYLNLNMYRQIIKAIATERMRKSMREKIRELQRDDDVSAAQINILLDVVEEITFDNSVMPRHGDRLSIINIAGQFEMEGADYEILGALCDIAEEDINELNEGLLREVTDTLRELGECLPSNPDTEDWKDALYTFNQLLGSLDQEGRYLGDV